MNEKIKSIEETEALSRHQRKCVICHHPEREDIEQEYLNWRSVWRISREFQIDDYRSISRHAEATGLVLRRRENFRPALDQIIEQAADARVTGDMVIRAIRAHCCLDGGARWTEPPTNVIFTVIRTTQAADAAPIPASPVQSIVREEVAQPEPLPPVPAPAPARPAPQPLTSDSDVETHPVPLVAAAAAAQGTAPAVHVPPLPPPAQPPVTVQLPTLIYGTGIRNDANTLKT